MLLRLITWIARIALVGIIAAALLFSLTDRFPFALANSDKILHLIGYGLLTIVAIIAWPNHRRIVALSAMALGTGVELMQFFTPSRSFSLEDLVANAVGIAFATVFAWFVKTRFVHRKVVAEETRLTKQVWQEKG